MSSELVDILLIQDVCTYFGRWTTLVLCERRVREYLVRGRTPRYFSRSYSIFLTLVRFVRESDITLF